MNQKKIGDICDILNGYAFKSSKYVDEGIRVIRITNVQKGFIEDADPQYYPISEQKEIEKYMLYEGDLLISLTGNVGRVALLGGDMLPAALNQRVACIRVKVPTLLDKQFLFYLLNSDYFEQECILSAKGIAQKNMSTEWLRDFSIPLPSIETQHEIVTNLDKISALIEKRQAQLTKLDQLVKSRFVEMFGDPVSNPHNWEKKSLSDLAEIKIGPFGSLLHKEDYIENAHALVNPSHIANGKISVDLKLTVSDEKYNDLSAYHLFIDDVVMGRRGEMGRCAVVSENGLLCGTGCMIIRTNGKLKADFIQKIISFPSFKKTIEDMAVGQTMPNLNVPIVSNFMIICPPVEAQEQYYLFAEQVDKSKLAIQKSLDELETLKKALMQQYFG